MRTPSFWRNEPRLKGTPAGIVLMSDCGGKRLCMRRRVLKAQQGKLCSCYEAAGSGGWQANALPAPTGVRFRWWGTIANPKPNPKPESMLRRRLLSVAEYNGAPPGERAAQRAARAARTGSGQISLTDSSGAGAAVSPAGAAAAAAAASPAAAVRSGSALDASRVRAACRELCLCMEALLCAASIWLPGFSTYICKSCICGQHLGEKAAAVPAPLSFKYSAKCCAAQAPVETTSLWYKATQLDST